MKSAELPENLNARADNWGDAVSEENPINSESDEANPINSEADENPPDSGIIHSRIDEDGNALPMAIIDIDDLVGQTITYDDNNGETQQLTIIEAIKNHQDDTRLD